MNPPEEILISPPEDSAPALKSVFDSLPTELGGIYARQGFSYQDHVAAKYLIEMLRDDRLVEVSCETHDDIRLVWCVGGVTRVEFIQVKSDQPDQLWTVAKLCERTKSPTKPDGVGSSILEKSLSKDAFLEPSWFRMVTCRQIHSSLEILVLERGHEQRRPDTDVVKSLDAEVAAKLSNSICSAKGNTYSFWLQNACWDVLDDKDIFQLNCQSLAQALHDHGFPSDPLSAKGIYEGILKLSKDAAEYGIERWNDKKITKSALIEMIRCWIDPYPDLAAAEKLEAKLIAAGIDEIGRNAAKDQRRNYIKKRRTPGFLTPDQVEDFEYAILDTLSTLRSSLDSGELDLNGIAFHHICLKGVEGIDSLSPSNAASLSRSYLHGCMYEITARCRHRFVKVSS